MENNFNPEKSSFDFHVHTNAGNREPIPQWWHNVLHNPEEAVKQAKKNGLDGIAVTDHNTIKGLDEALNSAAKHGLIVIPGIEISARNKFTPHPRHIIALGIDPEITQANTIPKNQSIETVIKWIHDQGSIAIAAHPKYPEISIKKQAPLSLTTKQLTHFSQILDGVETLTLLGHNQPISQWAEINNVSQLGGSDAHHIQQIGLVRTEIFGTQINTWQDVIQAIRAKQTKPFTDASLETLKQNSYQKLIFQPTLKKNISQLSRFLF